MNDNYTFIIHCKLIANFSTSIQAAIINKYYFKISICLRYNAINTSLQIFIYIIYRHYYAHLKIIHSNSPQNKNIYNIIKLIYVTSS